MYKTFVQPVLNLFGLVPPREEQRQLTNEEHMDCLESLNEICLAFNRIRDCPAKLRFYLKGGYTYHIYGLDVETEDIDGFFLLVNPDGSEFTMPDDDATLKRIH